MAKLRAPPSNSAIAPVAKSRHNIAECPLIFPSPTRNSNSLNTSPNLSRPSSSSRLTTLSNSQLQLQLMPPGPLLPPLPSFDFIASLGESDVTTWSSSHNHLLNNNPCTPAVCINTQANLNFPGTANCPPMDVTAAHMIDPPTSVAGQVSSLPSWSSLFKNRPRNANRRKFGKHNQKLMQEEDWDRKYLYREGSYGYTDVICKLFKHYQHVYGSSDMDATPTIYSHCQRSYPDSHFVY